MIETLKNRYQSVVYSLINQDFKIEEPKKSDADFAIPLFKIANMINKNINETFEILKEKLQDDEYIDKIVFERGFLNIYLNRVLLSKKVLKDCDELKSDYAQKHDNSLRVYMDYSSPNIAKNFSVGHLRSTIIGNSLKHIYKKNGYNVFVENYLGDWGTQFGKMIVAYKRWGDEKVIEKDPVNELQKLYVKFHEEEKNDPTLEEDARKVFKAMEEGNEEYLAIWKRFREESLILFSKMYKLLNVEFDSYNGEAYYNNLSKQAFDKLTQKGLLKEDAGCMIVNVGDDIPPALITRSDGATLYLLRDVATFIERYNTFKMDHMLYVVGNEQKLHFEQLKRIIGLLGYKTKIEHINFGLVLQDGKKMSTRGGNTKTLMDVLVEAQKQAKNSIIAKNPSLPEIDTAARKIGIGAIVFNDLKNERHLDVDFKLENMLKFEGQTGPYLQYTSVRINSILKNVELNIDDVDYNQYKDDSVFELIKLIAGFSERLTKACESNMPSVISRYLLSIAQVFNQIYAKQKFIVEDKNILASNILLLKSTRQVINEGLRILGIDFLDEM